jgi:integrase
VQSPDIENSEDLKSSCARANVAPAHKQESTKKGAWTLARRRWQEGTVYIRKSKTLPDAWWGRFVETVENESGTTRVHRNVRLGESRYFTRPLAKRALRDYVDEANNFQPQAVKIKTMGKAATPFSLFVERWQEEMLGTLKASTAATVKGHIKNFLLPAFGKLAIGDIDSERVQKFLNRFDRNKVSVKTIKNIWATLLILWKRAVAWNYVSGELLVVLPKRGKKRKMSIFTTEQVKCILANTEGEEQIFYWLTVETGMRLGEIIALRADDFDAKNHSIEVSKAISVGIEDSPKSDAGERTICISARLSAAIKEYLAGRTDGHLFQTSDGQPWNPDNVRNCKLNPLLDRLKIPKHDLTRLAKIIGKDRAIAQATRSEWRAVSLCVHSFRHTNETAMDALGFPMQIRKQRLGHSSVDVTGDYTHTFTQDERAAAEKLGDFFGTGWPAKDEGNLIAFPKLSQKQEGLEAVLAASPCKETRIGCGGWI